MENFKLLSARLKWAVDQRLNAEPRITRITKGKLALEAGVSPPAVGYWFADTNGIQAPAARKLGAFLGVDAVWLEKGEGSPDVKQIAEPSSFEWINEGDDKYVPIPLVEFKLVGGFSGYQTVPLGEGNSTFLVRTARIRKLGLNPANLVATEIKGDSMETALFAGDIAVVDTSRTEPKDNEVFAINYEGEAVVKRMVREAKDWWLTSDNESPGRHQRKICRGDECIIVGQVMLKESDRI